MIYYKCFTRVKIKVRVSIIHVSKETVRVMLATYFLLKQINLS